MGRRAKKAPVQTKKRATLAKRFKCPFCANDEVVECKMDFRAGVGSLECRLCGAMYQMPIHHLHEPVDVFSEWLDDCEAAQQGRPNNTNNNVSNNNNNGAPHDDDDDDDDDLGEASGMGRTKEQPPPPKAAVAQRQSYTSLGLDDSDDDDSDE